MAQQTGKILPQFINTDKGFEDLKPDEAAYMKGLSWDINANPGSSIGTGNPSGEGQNLIVLTPIRSNEKLNGIILPDVGWNKNVGTFESQLTKELYYFNYNSGGFHGIYVINGENGSSSKVIIDPKLAFTDNQDNVATTRVMLRFVRGSNGEVIEKHLLWTDGQKWQGWVNVVAAIATNGFDQTLFPYWTLRPPHFDREELFEWPVRPPMVKPIVTIIPNTAADLGKINRVADKNFRFAYDFINTDGRMSTFSPYSLPLQIKTEEYINNIDNLPKRATLKFSAGSPLTEKIRIYVQRADSTNSLDATAVYGDWILYDTIEKFDTDSSGQYWTRTNQWASYNYNSIFNTIEFEFDNSKVGTIISQQDANRLQSAMPQLSQAATDIDDGVLLCNNRYGYNNLSKEQLSNLSVTVNEKTQNTCSAPMRTIYLYAYAGQAEPGFRYTSQVGYTYGDDKTVRFGGLEMGRPLPGVPDTATLDLATSKFYQLDFADRNSFRVYLKGTPYYADAEWFILKQDNTIEAIDTIYDFKNADQLLAVQQIFKSGGCFICRFKLNVPAGRYIATLGRHNVASTGDYKNTSTYIYGIADLKNKSSVGSGQVSIKPNAIVSYSKEMELDCTSANIDMLNVPGGNLFYVYTPWNRTGGGSLFRFFEGYLKQSSGNPLPVELFPYQIERAAGDDWGKNTDKNGFYWGYTKSAISEQVDIEFSAKINCAINTKFKIPTSAGGSGWKKNSVAYISDHGGSGECNWVVFTGKVTDLSGLIGYSNIAVSMKDGPTVFTRSDGTFSMFVHNGMPNLRTSNVYVNAGGNFLITLDNCTPLSISVFNESLAPCSSCTARNYPVPLNLRILIQNNTQVSVKEAGKYTIGCVVADLAGRMTFINKVVEKEVSSFLQRGNINATYFRMLIGNSLNLSDFKWFAPYISKNVSIRRQLQWVGDELLYLDSSGNIVTDPVSASFVKIVIKSLYDLNVSNNFSLLSSYQFAKGDRLRILDDGDGNLLSVSSFGNPIDVQVLGTNYNQAAINAGIAIGTVNTNQSTDPGLIVRYDQRLDLLSEKTGFWIEVYTPVQENDVVPMFEVGGFYPIINGAISEFAGYSSGVPVYNKLTFIDIDFWDTYFLQRSILGKYFSHPFESENVTDNWGKNITSGGRISVENKDAAQEWFGGDVIRSDSFLHINGLATFRDESRKNYGIYPFGEIVAAHTRRNMVAFNCSADWFIAEYNMPYTKVANGQLVVTNLDDNLSLPKQKGGSMHGIEKEDLETIIIDNDFFFWYDRKNTGFIKCNYQDSTDISQENGEEKGGIQSYLNAKTWFISDWNNSNSRSKRFDVVAGVDSERGNIYLTFRPRKSNSNNAKSYLSTTRDLDLKGPETFVYSIQYKGWMPCANFAPEAYAKLRGSWANVEMFSFAAGVPYIHNNTANDSFLKFFGVQCEPVVKVAFNKEDYVKIFGSVSFNCHGSTLFIDYLFDEQTNCYSYIPKEPWREKEHITYAPFFRNMVTFPPTSPDELYRSMLHDGKRIFGDYAICRFVQIYEELGRYFQLSDISYLFVNSHPTKP